MKKILKIDNDEILPEFKEVLGQYYEEFKDNDKFHREKKAEKRKKKSEATKRKKIKEIHLKFIKEYIDNENNKESVCLRTLVKLL